MAAIICLSKDESAKLRELERTIKNGVKSFIEVGNALREIRDSKLYRESHKTFEAYVKERWDFDRTYAHRLMESAEVAEELLPIGNKNKKVDEINTEGQMRELVDVPTEWLPEVIDKATEIAGDGRLTAKVLREAREEVMADDDEPSPATTREEDDATDFLGEFKKFWKKVSPLGKRAIRVWLDENYLEN